MRIKLMSTIHIGCACARRAYVRISWQHARDSMTAGYTILCVRTQAELCGWFSCSGQIPDASHVGWFEHCAVDARLSNRRIKRAAVCVLVMVQNRCNVNPLLYSSILLHVHASKMCGQRKKAQHSTRMQQLHGVV